MSATKEIVQVGAPGDLLVKEDENISRSKSVAERQSEVQTRAIDIFDNGQIQPVRCYQGKSDRPKVYIGFTRVAAVELIRKGFEYETGETEEVETKDATTGDVTGKETRKITRTIHDPEFPLRYVVDDITAEEAIVRGARDNWHNDKPNDMDLAVTVQALQTAHGWTDTKVTQLLGISDPFKVGRVKKLLKAPEFVQTAVANGALATAAALEVVEAEGEGRKAAVALIREKLKETEGTKGPTQAAIRKAISEGGQEGESRKGAKGKGGSGKGSGGPALSSPEIRKFFETLVDNIQVPDGDEESAIYRDFAKDTLRWLNGKLKDKTYLDKLDNYFGVAYSTSLSPKSKAAATEGATENANAEELATA